MTGNLIYQQIPKVMGEIDAISKSRDNKAQGFKFRGIDDVINEVSAKLAKHRLFVVPEVIDERREERQTKSGGTSTYVTLKIKYTLFAEDGSSVSAVMIGEGADTGDKASNKAQSIALKYFFLQVFAIPTEDAKDPDADSHEFAPKKQPDRAAVPKSLIEQPSKKGPSPETIAKVGKQLKAHLESPEFVKAFKADVPSGPKLKDPRTVAITFGKFQKHGNVGNAIDKEGLPAVQDYAGYLLGQNGGDADQMRPGVKAFYEAVQAITERRDAAEQASFEPGDFDTAADVARGGK